MKNIIAAVFMAVTSIAAMAQAVDQASIAQKQRQQANAGAASAQAAYDKGGLVGVAELSAACFNDAKTGARASDYCLGIEAVGVTARDKSPDADASAKSWFDHPQMTNRVLTHCIQFLGLRGDMACAQRLAVARAAIPERSQAPAVSVPQPAFDCQDASNRVERLICSNHELARLDVELSEIFNLAKGEHPRSINGETGKTSFPLGADQTRWRTKVRDACKDVACVKTAYERRAIEIKTKFPY